MPTCEFFDRCGDKIGETEVENNEVHDAVAKRAAISQFNWEGDYEEVTVRCSQ